MRFIFCLSIILTGFFSNAQHQDLLNQIKSSDNWEEKKILYDSLIARSSRDEVDDYINTLQLVIEEGKAVGQYDFSVEYLLELADVYHHNNLPIDTLQSMLKEALVWNKNGISEAKKGDLLSALALCFFYADKQDSALYYYLESAEVFHQLADSSQSKYGKAYLHAAGIAMDLGQYQQAVNLIEKSEGILEYQNDSLYLLYAYSERANIYSMNGFLKKASEQREHLLTLATPSKHRLLMVITYLNYSNEARKLKKDSLELAVLLKATTLLDSSSLNSRHYHFLVLTKLMNVYSRQEQFDEAIKCFNQIQTLEPDFRETAWLQEYYLRAKADLLYCKGQYNEAITLTKKIREEALGRKEIETVMDMDRLLNRIYLAQKDYKNAYLAFSEFSQIRDSLTSVEKTNAVLFLQEQYESEKKKRVIADQENEIKYLATTNDLQTKLIWLIVFGSVFLSGAVYLFISRRNAKAAQNAQEEFSRKLLAAHESERKRISMDLHDSVGQSLMLIKNKVVLNQDQSTIQMVSKALEEVRSISKALHPVLLDKFGLTASIEKLIKEFDEQTEIFFTEEIDNIDGIFSKENELQIFRILQETLNNLVKHADSPSALIRIINSPSSVELLVQDYGIGFDILSGDFNKSLGMKTLKERTQILGGKIIITSVKGEGTSILLKLNKLR